MSATPQERTRHREIRFQSPHAVADQAGAAAFTLRDLEGILSVQPSDNDTLRVVYDLPLISLQVIEELLIELGFHLDNSLLSKLKRALFYYTEAADQETLGCQRERSNCTQAIFVNRYQQLQHGCRDDRPDYWRRYL